MSRKSRINLALVLIGAGLIFNVITLVQGDESPGWPLAATILLFVAGFLLLVERRGL